MVAEASDGGCVGKGGEEERVSLTVVGLEIELGDLQDYSQNGSCFTSVRPTIISNCLFEMTNKEK